MGPAVSWCEAIDDSTGSYWPLYPGQLAGEISKKGEHTNKGLLTVCVRLAGDQETRS